MAGSPADEPEFRVTTALVPSPHRGHRSPTAASLGRLLEAGEVTRREVDAEVRGLRTVLRSKDAALGGLKQEAQRLARRLGAAEAEARRRAAEADGLRKARAELAGELERERRNKTKGRAGRAGRKEPPGRDDDEAARLQFDLEGRKNEARLLRGEVRNLKILLRSKDQALGRLKKEAGRLAERLDEARVAIRHREAEVSHSPKGWVGKFPAGQTMAAPSSPPPSWPAAPSSAWPWPRRRPLTTELRRRTSPRCSTRWCGSTRFAD